MSDAAPSGDTPAVRLTSEIGRPATTAEGEPLGVLVDLTVGLGGRSGKVQRLGIGRRGRIETWVEWSDVASYGPEGIRLRADATPVSSGDGPPSLDDDEVLLGRDVLDTQIIDVDGHRVERVGDVLLARVGDLGLEAIAVDVGRRPVLRRLGLHRMAERLAVQAVDWTDLHLTSARGHLVQLATPAAAVHRLDAEALTALISRLSTQHAADVLAALPTDRAVAALDAAHPDLAVRIVPVLDEAAASPLIARLSPRTRHHLALHHDRPRRRRFRRHRVGHAPWRRQT